jgi:putative acetyltransferase
VADPGIPSRWRVEQEPPRDAAAIRLLTTAAFSVAAHSNQAEAKIVDALRDAGALTLSLIVSEDGDIVGHAAFSPVRIDDRASGWYGLGPVSVRPDRQRTGVGSAIIRDGLQRLRALEAAGCVVFGDPGYYGRFGFVSDREFRYADAPDGFFQRIVFTPPPPTGEVTYHSGFDAV